MKKFRFKATRIFGLDPKEKYIVTETDHGYTMKVGEKQWIGFPKSIVEKCRRIFEPLDGTQRKPEIKRTRVITTKKQNHV